LGGEVLNAGMPSINLPSNSSPRFVPNATIDQRTRQAFIVIRMLKEEEHRSLEYRFLATVDRVA